MMIKSLAFFGLIAMAGCGSVVLPTVAKLSGLSPLDADPAGFTVAIDMPQGASMEQGDATFIIETRHTGLDHYRREVFALERQRVDDGTLTFRIAPADLDRVRDIQSQSAAWEDSDPKLASGSISVSATPCLIGDGPDLDDSFSISLRIKPSGPLLPLVRNAKVSDLLAEVGTELEDRSDLGPKQCALD